MPALDRHTPPPGLVNATPSTRTVDVHVAWLRQKIEPNPRYPRHLRTVHGLGYEFVG
jgi:DNA-binding response OmpR family regulator